MAREAPPEIRGPSALRPVASPVDSYVRPAAPQRSNLHDLAGALGKIDRDLSGFLNERKQQTDKIDKIRGEAAFNKANQQGWAEAVRSGSVPANASPIFQESYKSAQGNIEGGRLRDLWAVEYQQWGGRNSDDPAVFEDFFKTFVRENVQSDDPYVLQGLNPHIRALHENARATHRSEVANRTYDGSVEAHVAGAGIDIDSANDEGLRNPLGTDYEGLWSSLLSKREEALTSGIKPEDFDKSLQSAIAAKTLEHRDPGLVELLDRKLPGRDYSISDTADGQKLKQTILSDLEQMAISQMSDEARQQKKADDARKDEIVRGLVDTLYEDPQADIPDEVLKEWSRYEPEARVKAMELRAKIIDGQGQEDPRAILELYQTLREPGASASDVTNAVSGGVIQSHTEFKKALDFLKTYQEARQGDSKIFKSQAVTRIRSTIKTRTTADGIVDPFNTGGWSDDGLAAAQDFEYQLLEWSNANPEATQFDIDKAANMIGAQILGSIDGDDRSYGRSVSSEAGNPHAVNANEDRGGSPIDPSTPPQTDQNPQGNPEAQSTERWTSGDVPPSLEQLPEAQRTLIKNEAKRLGVDPEIVKERMWKRLKAWTTGLRDKVDNLITSNPRVPKAEVSEIPPGGDVSDAVPLTPPEAQSNDPAGDQPTTVSPNDRINQVFDQLSQADTPQEAADLVQQASANLDLGTIIDASVNDTVDIGDADDPTVAVATVDPNTPEGRAKPLLELIGGIEAPDGYNQMYGERKASLNLGAMTLDEVKALQRKRVKSGIKSSAVGRYQFLHDTLMDLRKINKLSGSEKFTPELQDKLALSLLNRRGYSKYLKGQISQKQFANRLAKEWASLPVVSGSKRGRSYYAGDGLNKALIQPDAILTALGGISKPTAIPKNRPPIYANISDREIKQFMEWNPDPVGNHEANLKSIKPSLSSVVKRAKEISKVPFVLGSGKRTKELQAKALQWGWSKSMNSRHLTGDAGDMWPLDANGQVNFSVSSMNQVAKAMKQAAKELDVIIEWGGDWKSFRDRPHFQLPRSA